MANNSEETDKTSDDSLEIPSSMDQESNSMVQNMLQEIEMLAFHKGKQGAVLIFLLFLIPKKTKSLK